MRLNRKVAMCMTLQLLLILMVAGCAAWRISYFDSTTYKNLTDVKPEVLALYDTFTGEDIDNERIEYVRLEIAQIYEYEKGKKNNSETTRQVEIIRDMFERHIENRLEKGKWSNEHLMNQKENIEEAFDIAIATERAKNKNE